MNNNFAECKEHYQQAFKAAHKEQRQRVQSGSYPYLQILDEILPDYMTAGEVNLGLIDIPIDKIVGTKTKGRTHAFAANFMPLLSEDSEFGLKWRNLCNAHLSDAGIRDPISCYEFLGRFYVQEGNKRVSVLKYFGAASIPGNVIRILPGESMSKEVVAYKAFLGYYPLTKLYQIYFTQPDSFVKFQAAMGYEPEHIWTEEEQRRFLSGYCFFSEAFHKLGGGELEIPIADAMLAWLKVYPFGKIREMSAHELTRSMEALWPDLKSKGIETHIEVHTRDVSLEGKEYRNRRMFSLMPSYLNVAFVHEMKPEHSNWILAHEEGSLYLEKTMGEQVVVQRYSGVGTGEMAEKAMEIAIKNGAELIFTTTAPMIKACRRVAARHPEVKIFNCSVYMPYSDVRTYYSRIYEGKFISGAIAGALTRRNDIGYIASYPIYGVPAGINAFALGAQLTNPNARIHLKWSCTESNPVKELQEQNIEIISALDIPQQTCKEGQWGTFRLLDNGASERIASPYWDWGAFYVQITRSFLSKEGDSSVFGKREDHAVNYWWGIASGVVGLQWTEKIPEGTKALANLLKVGLKEGTVDPFNRRILSQDATVRNDGTKQFTAEQILRMDWLCENVIGSIPVFEALSEKGQAITRLQGIYRDQIPPHKDNIQI
ncbi:MAG: BMP family ABC transporter substrate-binding protein [Oscillospiraceae bacterium]|nr:BMP family ABC transporter substrate-binding protein [Oscillospiraceae bacterium]